MTLVVCSLNRLEETIARRDPSHLITLLSPREMIEEHPRLRGRHLRVSVHDIVEPLEGHTAPCEAMVDAILEFGEAWRGERPLLVHCWAGISRSSASAYILACAKNPDADERVIAKALRRASPIAQPNALLVRLADRRLGRKGRMSAALEAVAPARQALENVPFDLPFAFVAG